MHIEMQIHFNLSGVYYVTDKDPSQCSASALFVLLSFYQVEILIYHEF